MNRRLRFPVTAGCASAVLLAWPTVGYPLTLRALSRKRRRRSPRGVSPWPQTLPSISVIVPTFNEAPVIERRLTNIAESDYPADRVSIVVVDSASEDDTVDRVRRWSSRHPAVDVTVLEEQQRNGKAAALNVGLAIAGGDLIVMTDAPTTFDRDALRLIVQPFENPMVGAATGYFTITGEGRIADTEASFWRMRNALRTLEAAVDSTPFVNGELCCFRRGLVREVAVDSLADDMNVALQIRRAGYRVVVHNAAKLSEPRSNRAGELLTTKSRRAAGGIQELVRARDMLFKRRYGAFGWLILPSAWLYYLPLRVPVLAMVGTFAHRRGVLRRVLPSLVCAAAICLVARPIRQKAVAQLTLLGLNETVLLLGWHRLVVRRTDVKWSQERSTRAVLAEEPTPMGAGA